MHRSLSGRIIFYLFFLLVIDMCFTPILAVNSIRPILIYLMIPYVAFEWHWERTFPLALIVGLMRDFLGTHPLGVETTVLAVFSLIFDFMIHKIERKAIVMRFVATFLFILAVTVSIWLLSAFLKHLDRVPWYILFSCLETALYTTFFLPFFFYFTSRWFSGHSLARQYELFR